jgi:DNA-binding transcriptional regulator YiaG
MAKRKRSAWDAHSVKGLRRHLALTQEELAGELGVRQQTVSEWETGAYRPRGASERVLSMVAEQAGFIWGAPPEAPAPEVRQQATGSEERE